MMTPTEALVDYLEARGLALDTRYLREALHILAQALMECDVRQALDAALYERNGSRRAYRNGYRQSLWRTDVGDIPLNIPRLRKGSYFPHFLNADAEAILLRLVQDTYVMGVQRTDVETALADLAGPRLQPYDMADIVERLADVVYSAQDTPILNVYPALFFDVLDVEYQGMWRQLLVVLGLQRSGETELLAHDLVSATDDRAWARLLRRLRQRGLSAVDVVVSDDYAGMRTAVQAELVEAVWRHHRNFLLRGSGGDALVNAVSQLAVKAETDSRRLPRMQWPMAELDFGFIPENLPFLVVA